MFCSKCGANLKEKSKFCIRCGAEVILANKASNQGNNNASKAESVRSHHYIKNEVPVTRVSKFENRSRVMVTSAILGTLYMFYLLSYFGNGVTNTEGYEQVGAAIATALIMPHFILLVLAVIFNWIGFFYNKKWAAITSGTLYSVSMILFVPYFIFELPMVILSFVAIGKIDEINKRLEANS